MRLLRSVIINVRYYVIVLEDILNEVYSMTIFCPIILASVIEFGIIRHRVAMLYQLQFHVCHPYSLNDVP